MDKKEIKAEKVKRKAIRRVRRYARWVRVKHALAVLVYSYVYARRYRDEEIEYMELLKELDRPYKVAAFVNTWVDWIPGQKIDTFRRLIDGDTVTDKTVVLFINTVLKYHGYRTYGFWIGFRGSRIMPLSAIIFRDVTITMHPSAYKVHIGDQFDIMRDYLPNGNRWIVMDTGLENIIMSYSKNRSKLGSPDICVYDTDYWGKRMPFAMELINKLKLKPISQRGEVV